MALRVCASPRYRQSENTLKAYKDTLRLYISFLEQEKKIDQSSLCASCFEKEYIEEWLAWLMKRRHCSADTRNARLSALRAFLKYLAGKDVKYIHIQQAATQIPLKKTAKKKVHGLSRAAVKALLDQPDQRRPAGRRDLTLLVLMYNTAVRMPLVSPLTGDLLLPTLALNSNGSIRIFSDYRILENHFTKSGKLSSARNFSLTSSSPCATIE